MAERGAPLKKLDLPDGWEMDILAIYADGGNDVEVKAEIRAMRGTFSNDLWDRWMKDEPNFSETIKEGRLLSEAWWNKLARKNLTNKEFNSTLWYMNMKNRFGWTDKVQTEHSGKIESTQITYIQQSGNEPIKES